MSNPADNDVFLNLIQHHKKLIYKVCNSYCKDAEDRKDLVQEVIVRLWQSYPKYDDRYKLSTWMYRIALNTAISHYRSGRRRNESTFPLADSLIDIADENTHETELDEQIKTLYKIINSMNEMNRALMILYLDSNSYKDMADILGITETNVATRISRLKQQLKEQFKNN